MSNNFAIVFPGQGSQHLGMVGDLYSEYSQVRDLYSSASTVLGYDLWDLTQNGPEDKLNSTEYTQPALLAASMAVWQVFTEKFDVMPKVLAGHSLGEYSALVAAKSLDFSDAIKLVAARGRFMQEAVPFGTGAMSAILGLDPEQISKVTDNISGVEIANLNAIGQTVIAGTKDSVMTASEKLKEAGAKLVKLLDVSVPSHCSLMQPAADNLESVLAEINIHTPVIPVIHNFSLEGYADADKIRHALIKQLTSPVRWVETIQSMVNMGVEQIYEFGPGTVLSKLIKRIDKNISSSSVNSIDSLESISINTNA